MILLFLSSWQLDYLVPFLLTLPIGIWSVTWHCLPFPPGDSDLGGKYWIKMSVWYYFLICFLCFRCRILLCIMFYHVHHASYIYYIYILILQLKDLQNNRPQGVQLLVRALTLAPPPPRAMPSRAMTTVGKGKVFECRGTDLPLPVSLSKVILEKIRCPTYGLTEFFGWGDVLTFFLSFFL
jgi:hypothetical protein